MKTVLLIGKLNQLMQEISDHLSDLCKVQLCVDNADTIRSMIDMTKPNAIIVSMAGFSLTINELFVILERECLSTPMIVIGNNSDKDYMETKGLLRNTWIRFLHRPVKLEDIYSNVQDLIFTETQSGEEKKKEEKAHILLVDDNPMMLRTIQPILSRKYKVSFATSGVQAIASIAKNRPDLILLDYEMPVCDGKKTFEMLRADEYTRDIPVVFLTGIANSDNVTDVLALHPDGYLLKPCREKKMFSTIEDILNARSKES